MAIPLFDWMRPDQFNASVSTASCNTIAQNLLNLYFQMPVGGEVGAPTNGQPYIVLSYIWQAGSSPAVAPVDLLLWFTDPWQLPQVNGLNLGAM